jgi:hypothetical protein
VKKVWLFVIAVFVLAAAAPARANQIQVGYPGKNFGPFQSGVGGEFTLNDVPDSLDLSGYVDGITKTKDFGPAGITSFQTFCIEVSEHIHGYDQKYYFELNTSALWGSTGSSVGDRVSIGTGWLYRQFATGTLLGYSYGDSTGANGGSYPGYTAAETTARKASAYLLQQAFWWLENETGAVVDPITDPFDPSENPFVAAVVGKFGVAGAKADGAEKYGVYAVNLWKDEAKTMRAQDQLILQVPDSGGALGLLALGLVGLAVAVRRS